MGMAGAAPMDTYRRRFGITDHAIERYRERAGDWLRERGHLDPVAVGNGLDARIAEAWDRGNGEVVPVVSKEGPAYVVDIYSNELGRLYAIVVDNRNPESLHALTVVTILTGDMHDANWRNQRWLTPEDAKKRGMATSAPAVALAPPPVATPPVSPMKAPPPASFFLRWAERGEEHANRDGTYKSEAEVRQVLKALATEGCHSFTLYGEIPLKLRIEVDF